MVSVVATAEKLQAALVKTHRGRIYIALQSPLPHKAVGVVYDTTRDVMALVLENDHIVQIAEDMDLEFSNQIREQNDIAVVSVDDNNEGGSVKLPISLQ